MAKKNKANKEKLSATYNYSDSKDKQPSYSDCKDCKSVKDSDNSPKSCR